MSTFYNNPPPPITSSSEADTVKLFDLYKASPVSIDAALFDAISGVFEKRGFSQTAAKSMAYIMIKQATLDKVEPNMLIDILSKLDNAQLSKLLAEVVNFNRLNTSSIGIAPTQVSTHINVARNIFV